MARVIKKAIDGTGPVRLHEISLVCHNPCTELIVLEPLVSRGASRACWRSQGSSTVLTPGSHSPLKPLGNDVL